MRQICYDAIKLDQGHIIEDSKCCLKIRAVITRSGVYRYNDGYALKSPMNLLRALPSARSAKLVLDAHPENMVVMSQREIAGGVEKPFWSRNKMYATLNFDKHVIDETKQQKIRNAVAKNIGVDVSIGFYYKPIRTPGMAHDVNTGQERPYDYVMTDIVIDHVVACLDGSNKGRCTFPNCGIGVDTAIRNISIENDKVVKRGDKWCIEHTHGAAAGTLVPGSCHADKSKTEAMHRAILVSQHSDAAKAIAAIAKVTDITALDEKTARSLFGDAGKPPKAWWDACTGKAQSFADDPARFCGWLYSSGPEALKQAFGSASRVGGNQEMSEEEGQTPYEACILKNMNDGMTRAEAEDACKDLKPAGGDQEETKTPWQKCLIEKKAQNMTDEEAIAACTADGVAMDQEPTKTETPTEETKPLPTPLEQCVANRMDVHKESEADATAWCLAELGGEHTPAEEIITDIEDLEKKARERVNIKRKSPDQLV